MSDLREENQKSEIWLALAPVLAEHVPTRGLNQAIRECVDAILPLIGSEIERQERETRTPKAVQVLRLTALSDRRVAELKAEIERLRSMLSESALQLQYMHDRFSETGSGNAILARIKSCLRVSDINPEGEDAKRLRDEVLPARSDEVGDALIERLNELSTFLASIRVGHEQNDEVSIPFDYEIVRSAASSLSSYKQRVEALERELAKGGDRVYAPDGRTWQQFAYAEAERRGAAEASLAEAREALERQIRKFDRYAADLIDADANDAAACVQFCSRSLQDALAALSKGGSKA